VVDDKPIDIVSEGYDAGIRYGHYVPEGMVTRPDARAPLGGRSLAGLSGQAWTAADLEDLAAAHLPAIAAGRQLQLPVGVRPWQAPPAYPRAGPGDDQQYRRHHRGGQGRGRYRLSVGGRIRKEIEEGSLEAILEEWAAPSEPFHMYYSSRRHAHPALRKLIDIIRLQHGLSRLR
jgi:DNA-binding transcriptional LysR family regulator